MKEVWEDEYGQWSRDGNLLIHVEPSQKWKEENKATEPEPLPPSEIDLLRLELARSNAEMFETMLALMGGV